MASPTALSAAEVAAFVASGLLPGVRKRQHSQLGRRAPVLRLRARFPVVSFLQGKGARRRARRLRTGASWMRPITETAARTLSGASRPELRASGELTC